MNNQSDDFEPNVGCCAPRRRFLQLVGAGSLATVVAACGGANSPDPEPFRDVSAGHALALSVGSLQAVSGAPAIIGRDSNGVYAMTSTCTHEGCDIIHQGTISDTGVVCRCHGSQFDAVGNRVSGPAKSPLTHFAVDIDSSGNITIHGGTVVDASTRAPVSTV